MGRVGGGVVHGVRVGCARDAWTHVGALAVVRGARGRGLVEGRGRRLVGVTVHGVARVDDIGLAVDGVLRELLTKAWRCFRG